MNPFIKSNKLWLSLLGLAVIIVLLAFLFRPRTIDFKMSKEEAIKLVGEPSGMVARSIMAGNQLIDIRPTDQFAQGHPENAINIPVRNLLDEESLELFDRLKENGQLAVLYGSDELQAVAPQLLLQQMGYTNVKYLKAGLKSNGEFKETEPISDENAVIDMKSVTTNQKSDNSAEIKPEKKKAEAIITVKKQTSSGGGC